MDGSNLIMDIRPPMRSFVPSVQPRQPKRADIEPAQSRFQAAPARRSMDFYKVPMRAPLSSTLPMPVFKPHALPEPTPEPVNEIPYIREVFAPPAKYAKKSGTIARFRSVGQYLLLVGAGIFLGFASTDLQVGQIAIGVYGLIAVIFKIKSQYTFAGALITLILIPVLLATEREGLANNFAVYAYLLLVVGVISAAIELRRDRKVEATA